MEWLCFAAWARVSPECSDFGSSSVTRAFSKKCRARNGTCIGLRFHTNPCALRTKDVVRELGNSGKNIVRELPVAQSGRSCREPQAAENAARTQGSVAEIRRSDRSGGGGSHKAQAPGGRKLR